MRLAALASKLLIASLSLSILAGCNSFDCNLTLPASCPPSQEVPEDAGVPAGMQNACTACLSGSQAVCVEGDGITRECSCYAACDSSTSE